MAPHSRFVSRCAGQVMYSKGRASLGAVTSNGASQTAHAASQTASTIVRPARVVRDRSPTLRYTCSPCSADRMTVVSVSSRPASPQPLDLSSQRRDLASQPRHLRVLSRAMAGLLFQHKAEFKALRKQVAEMATEIRYLREQTNRLQADYNRVWSSRAGLIGSNNQLRPTASQAREPSALDARLLTGGTLLPWP
jgi:hypothetical protein